MSSLALGSSFPFEEKHRPTVRTVGGLQWGCCTIS